MAVVDHAGLDVQHRAAAEPGLRSWSSGPSMVAERRDLGLAVQVPQPHLRAGRRLSSRSTSTGMIEAP
jgi:hypothetical protein